eukprot:SAG31_NODE_905_length_11119_cov_2.887931_8_plen_102_part_00
MDTSNMAVLRASGTALGWQNSLLIQSPSSHQSVIKKYGDERAPEHQKSPQRGDRTCHVQTDGTAHDGWDRWKSSRSKVRILDALASQPNIDESFLVGFADT